jgi:uncharacterized membrane protein YkoI
MKTRALRFILPFAATLAFGIPAQADEKLTLEQVPPKVKETIQSNVQTGKIKEIERKSEKDKPNVYEVEYTATDGKNYELKIAEDGNLLKKKED